MNKLKQEPLKDLALIPWFLRSYLLIPSIYLVYLSIGILARFVPPLSKLLSKMFPSFWFPSVIICFLSIFVLYVSGKSLFPLKREFRWIILFFSILLDSLGSLGISEFLGVIAQIVIVLTVAKFWRYERSLLCGALIGSTVSFLFLIIGGVPLLNPRLRVSISSSPLRASFQVSSIFAAAYSSSKYGKRGLYVLFPLSIMAILLGYKGNLASIVIAALIAGMISSEVKIKEALSISTILALILFFVGTFVARLNYGSWMVPWFLYLVYRAGLTVHVFQEVAKASVPFGLTRGWAMLDPTKKVIADIIGTPRNVGITATLIGPATLDFGVLGAVSLSILLGIYMRAMHPSRKSNIQVALYSASLSRIVTLIDIGVSFVDLSFFLSLLYLSLESREES